MLKNTHCSYCGAAFAPGQPWPRTCTRCGNISYVNPIPVAVVLVPVEEGLLLVRRKIEPCAGMLAFPGGFIEEGESWQQAGARELYEETGLNVASGEIRLFDALSAPRGVILIFGVCQPRTRADIAAFMPNEETMELVVATAHSELAFPLHTVVSARYWQEREAPSKS